MIISGNPRFRGAIFGPHVRTFNYDGITSLWFVGPRSPQPESTDSFPKWRFYRQEPLWHYAGNDKEISMAIMKGDTSCIVRILRGVPSIYV